MVFLVYAEGGGRTLTPFSRPRILSPLRMPFRHPGKCFNLQRFGPLLQPHLESIRLAVLRVVTNVGRARRMGAMSTAIERLVGLNAVADDLATAMIADGRKFVNRAFERVENVTLPSRDYFETELVIVPTHFTLCHDHFSGKNNSYRSFYPIEERNPAMF
jgi:hypothetical protein